jgi:hypothetical protein
LGAIPEKGPNLSGCAIYLWTVVTLSGDLVKFFADLHPAEPISLSKASCSCIARSGLDHGFFTIAMRAAFAPEPIT